MQTVLDALVGVPALVRSSTLDMIATNSLARALYSVLYTDAGTAPNVARFTFLDPRARQFWRDWDQAADDLTAHLRAAANPLDRALTEPSANYPPAVKPSASWGPPRACAPTGEASSDSSTQSSARSLCATTTSN